MVRQTVNAVRKSKKNHASNSTWKTNQSKQKGAKIGGLTKNNNAQKGFGSKRIKEKDIEQEFDEDDESIAESEAFNSEDEERYGDYFNNPSSKVYQSTTKGKHKNNGMDTDIESYTEEEEDYDEDDEEDAEEDLRKSTEKDLKNSDVHEKGVFQEDEDSEKESSGNSSSDDPDDDDDDDEEDEEEDEEDHDKLLHLMESLPDSEIKKRYEKEVSGKGESSFFQSLPENEFESINSDLRERNNTESKTSGVLTLESLLSSIQDTEGFSAVKHQLKDMAITNAIKEKDANRKISVGSTSKKSKTLKPSVTKTPAPVYVQEKVERELTYSEQKGSVSRYLSQVTANRVADSVDYGKLDKNNLSANALVDKFSPMTSFEKSINDILHSNQVDDETKILEREEQMLQEKELTVDEIKARNAELAKMRALLFYQQIKKRRMNKIKSKTYRRMKKKERERNAEKERELLRIHNKELADELDEKDAMKRMKERMNLKHKNTSKWAKRLLNPKNMAAGYMHNAETRKLISEQLLQGEKLRQKALYANKNSDDEYDEDEDDDENAENEDINTTKARALALMHGMEDDYNKDIENQKEGKLKGVMGMAFMQRAVEKQKLLAIEEMNEVLQELEEQRQDEEFDSDTNNTSIEGDSQQKLKKEKEPMKKAQVKQTKEIDMERQLQLQKVKFGSNSISKTTTPISVSLQEREIIPQPDINKEDIEEEKELHVPSDLVEKSLEEMKNRMKNRQLISGNAILNLNNSSMGDTNIINNSKERKKIPLLSTNKDEIINPWLQPNAEKHRKNTSSSINSKSNHGSDDENSMDGIESQQLGGRTVLYVDSGKNKAHGRQATKAGTKFIKKIKIGGNEKSNSVSLGMDQELDIEKAVAKLIPSKSEKKKDTELSDRNSSNDEEHMYTQDELIKRAFASADDDFEDEFQKEKRSIMDEEIEEADSKRKRKRNTGQMLGWGDWALPEQDEKIIEARRKKRKGNQVKRESAYMIRRREEEKKNAEEKKKREKERLDHNLPNVVISHKRQKTLAPYKLAQVPYPFTSVEQYERSLRRPIGGEWNTSLTTKEMIAPKVKTRAGYAIKPIKLSKKQKQKK